MATKKKAKTVTTPTPNRRAEDRPDSINVHWGKAGFVWIGQGARRFGPWIVFLGTVAAVLLILSHMSGTLLPGMAKKQDALLDSNKKISEEQEKLKKKVEDQGEKITELADQVGQLAGAVDHIGEVIDLQNTRADAREIRDLAASAKVHP